MRPTLCIRPASNAVSPLSEVKRRATTCDSAAICTLCFHNASSIGSRCLNCAAALSCSTAKLSAAERTMLNPTRATAMRRSAILRPEVFSAAEFAMLSSLPASTGSEPSTFTTVSLLTFSSASARCILSTMSGTDGRSTLPCDNSWRQRLDEAEHHGVRDRARLDRAGGFRCAHTLSACRNASISSRDSASAGAAGGGIQPQAARGGHAGKRHLLGLRRRAQRDQRGADA